MADIILVLNAGSSSIKFRAYDALGKEPALLLKGQMEGLYTAPRFVAEDARGVRREERKWDQGEALGHQGAVVYIADFLRSHKEGHRLVAAGHRVVHGGMEFSQAVLVTPEVI